MDYFQRLEVSRLASRKTIVSSYRRLAKRHHPDVGGSATEFRLIKEAFETLNDPERRARYLASLENEERAAKASPPPPSTTYQRRVPYVPVRSRRVRKMPRGMGWLMVGSVLVSERRRKRWLKRLALLGAAVFGMLVLVAAHAVIAFSVLTVLVVGGQVVRSHSRHPLTH